MKSFHFGSFIVKLRDKYTCLRVIFTNGSALTSLKLDVKEKAETLQ